MKNFSLKNITNLIHVIGILRLCRWIKWWDPWGIFAAGRSDSCVSEVRRSKRRLNATSLLCLNGNLVLWSHLSWVNDCIVLIEKNIFKHHWNLNCKWKWVHNKINKKNSLLVASRNSSSISLTILRNWPVRLRIFAIWSSRMFWNYSMVDEKIRTWKYGRNNFFKSHQSI